MMAAIALISHTVDDEGELGSTYELASGCNWFVNWADTPSLAAADNDDWLTFYLQRSR
jgi:hypothetical protein